MVWKKRNTYTSDNKMPRTRKIKNSDTRKANSRYLQEESIREYPIYKKLKFAEEIVRWKAREPD